MTNIPTGISAQLNEGFGKLTHRARDLLIRPRATWAAIADEPATVRSIFIPYVLVLAAIGPLARFLGGQLFGYQILDITYRPPMASAAVSALLFYALTLVAMFLLARLIDALAPSFGAQKNPIQALKLAAYSGTAAWVAGAFGLIPSIGMFSMLGLYSLYLLYVGLPLLMKVPQDKAGVYVAAVGVAAAILLFLISAISSQFAHPVDPVMLATQ
ncbi:Yip1 family protein [Sphingopyxis sp. MWB1]|uniref:Yip1 family protein n=1 Tax=Sphingopyxis sp. MWB1 TaxID=1537715 RepID=UPI0009DF9A2C|nr:Yip1 family protein [Sphingopyxis sp. MWB1]